MGTVNVLFPLETLVRELDYRLALAVKYVDRRHRIFIGATYHTFRLLAQLGGGVYVGKHIFQRWKNPYGPSAYDLARARGFSVVHLSEEGAVFAGDDDYAKYELDRQLDPSTIHGDDFIATWGQWQADYYRSKGGGENVRATGHPRFDLYRSGYRAYYEDKVSELRRRFGKFVLINTNWMFALHPLGPEVCFSEVEGYHPEDDAKREWFITNWSRVARAVPAYIELIHRMSIKRKDVNFVIRPHPADDPTLLRAAFRGVPNVHIIHEGVVAPWILASRVMVHDGCTTGMEGYLLNHAIVSYQPVDDPESEFKLTNLFGVKCVTREDASDAILGAVDDPDACAAKVQATHIPNDAHALLKNFRSESFPLFIDVMHEAEGRRRANGDTPPLTTRRIRADEAKAWAIERAKRTVRPLFKLNEGWASLSRINFYGLKKTDIAPRLEVLQRIEKKRVDCKFHSESLIELTLAS